MEEDITPEKRIQKQIENYCDRINLTPEIFDAALEQAMEKTKDNNRHILWCDEAGYLQAQEAMKKALKENYEDHLKNDVEKTLLNTKPQSNFKLKK